MNPQSPEFYMDLALSEAQKAADLGEVPVGAVIVKDGEVIAQAHNLKESEYSALKHAELLVIEKASQKLGRWRLTDCELYVTLEPCVMCSGAIVQARLKTLYFGTLDPKGGGTQSLYQILQDERLNHQTEVIGSVLQDRCSRILTDFFKARRQQAKSN